MILIKKHQCKKQKYYEEMDISLWEYQDKIKNQEWVAKIMKGISILSWFYPSYCPFCGQKLIIKRRKKQNAST